MELKKEFEALDQPARNGGDRSPLLLRRGIIVVGSHRSGTSALARVLNLLGCDLPRHLMPPLEDNNELGFWEPATVVQAHEAFLARIGSSWDDVAPLPEGALSSAPAQELRGQLGLLLKEEYGSSPLFVVKDPRISRLLPLWFAVLEHNAAPVTAIAVRNPLEVAASLKLRDGFTTSKSLLLWLRHMLESEQHSRAHARSIVMYDELLRDWQGVLAKVGDDLDLTWPGRSHRATVEIENFLSVQQRHHVFDWSDVQGRVDVVNWVKEAYSALRHSDPAPILDQVRDELSQADIAFGPIVEEARLGVRAAREETLEVVAARDALATKVDAHAFALDARASEIQELHEEVAQLSGAVATATSRAATHEAEIAPLRAERDDLAQEVERISAEMRRLAAQVAVAQERVAAADANAASTRQERDAARAEASESRAATDEQVAAAHAALGALETQAAADRGKLLQQLQEAHSDLEQLTGRAFASASAAAAERRRLLADLEAANAKATLLAKELRSTSLDAQELTQTADELLLIAETELETSRAERDRLEAEAADAVEEQGQLLILVERLQSEIEFAQDAQETLKSQASVERAAFIAERNTARSEEERLVAELAAARMDSERFAAANESLERALNERLALLQAMRSVRKHRASRRRSLSQFGTWLLPPTPRRLNYLWRYWSLRRSGEFDADAYLLGNPDVLEAGINPLMHYVEYGIREGRLPKPDADMPEDSEPSGALATGVGRAQEEDVPPQRTSEIYPAIAHEFDASFYRQHYPDVPGVDADLLDHYLTCGWQEHRDPSAAFSTEYYLTHNHDINEAGINPLVHYVTHGRAEGRLPNAYRVSKLLKGYEPTVSAIVPAYNHAQFLQQRIESILAQERPPAEIVLLDDASTDGTRELIEELRRDLTIPIIAEFNGRNSGNVFRQWQKGLSLASGDLAWICESDDFCDAEFLDLLVPYFGDPSVTLAFGRVQFANGDGVSGTWLDHYRETASPGYWNASRVESAYEWFRGPFGRLNVIPNVGGCLFRRQLLSTRVWQETQRYSVCGDWYLYMHIAGGGRIAYEPQAVSYFRQHAGNTSVSNFSKPTYYREHAKIASALRRRYGIDDVRLCELYRSGLDQYLTHCPEERKQDFNRIFNLEGLIDQAQETRHVLMGILGFKTGGAELFPIYLANALIDRGYVVSVLVLDPEAEEASVRSRLRPEIPVYERGLVEEIGVDRFFKDHGIDLVHTHYLGVDQWIHEACRDAGVPYVVTLHGSYEVGNLGLEAKASLLGTVSRWVYTADKNLRVFDGIPIDRDAFTKLSNAVPAPPPGPPLSREEYGIPDEAFVFGIASRAIRAKGWDIAAEAMANLATEVDLPLYLALCGDGADYADLEAEYGGRPHILFLGNQRDVIAFYRMCDCCLLPTRFEGESFPFTLIESLMTGTPIIATDIGEIRSMVESDGFAAGIVLPLLESDAAFTVAVAAAMSRMLTEATKYAHGAKRLSKKYSFKKVTMEYEEIYRATANWPVSSGVTPT